MSKSSFLLKNFSFFFILLLLATAACRPQTSSGAGQKAPLAVKIAESDKAMIVSPHPLGTRAGLEILRQGGNGVDATIAVQFALAVVYPRAGNIAGGGFMLIRTPEGEVEALDYREKAPAKASHDMYLDEKGEVIPGLSQNSLLAVGVPGSVRGLYEAWKKYGQIKDFARLLQPAIRLAEEGFPISQTEADRLNRFDSVFAARNPYPLPFLRKGGWKANDILRQPELANTLKLIAKQGPDAFYRGPIAERLAAFMQQYDGLISREDLAAYESIWRKPIQKDFLEYTLYSMPPPSSGGIALAQLVEMTEAYPMEKHPWLSPYNTHLCIEAMRRAFADRAFYLGDSDFYPVPKEQLLDSLYLLQRMSDFNPRQAGSSDEVRQGEFQLQMESFETTHTSVVGPEGYAVSVTTTLNSNYGCKIWVPELGFFLNNEMDDFSAKPGVPNQFGLVGAEANAIAPGKRMLSSMSPTIVEKNGELFLVLGSPGGPAIITSVFEVVMQVARFGESLEKAISTPRYHHQWLPQQVWYEEGFPPALIDSLEELGHKMVAKKYIGLVKAVQVLPSGKLKGCGDPRQKDDHAEGM